MDRKIILLVIVLGIAGYFLLRKPQTAAASYKTSDKVSGVLPLAYGANLSMEGLKKIFAAFDNKPIVRTEPRPIASVDNPAAYDLSRTEAEGSGYWG